MTLESKELLFPCVLKFQLQYSLCFHTISKVNEWIRRYLLRILWVLCRECEARYGGIKVILLHERVSSWYMNISSGVTVNIDALIK